MMNRQPSTKGIVARLISQQSRSGAVLAVLVLVSVVFSLTLENFGSLNNAKNMLAQFGPLALLALGQMCVIVVRGFDISVGAVMSLSTVIVAYALIEFGIAGLVFAPIVGGVFGLLNGILIGIFYVQPIITTLGTLLLARGIALLISNNGQVVVVTGEAQGQLFDFSFGQFLGLPYSAVMTVLVFLAIALFLKKSRWGRKLFLVGGNPEAAQLIGVPTSRTIMLAYFLCGVCAGLASILILARTGTGLPTDAVGVELTAIAAAVIGGTHLTGGIANPLGVLFAALFIQVISSALSFSAISPYAGEAVMGLVILIAGSMDRATRMLTTASRGVGE